LMATLTPSGMASSSSEWLLRNCQRWSRSLMFLGAGCWHGGVHWPFGAGKTVRCGDLGVVAGDFNVHVLHLDGCCGLAVLSGS
jgi:hypothetical protein